jgi:isopenicillin N synthase-like dioxygenase
MSNVLIELHLGYENRKDEIRKQLVSAAEGAGFLTLVDHGITVEEIEAQFALARKFFDLPLEIKKQNPHNVKTNNGYEYKAQIRPSTGAPDQKESLWIQRTSERPSDENVPGFRETTENFLSKCEGISDKVRNWRRHGNSLMNNTDKTPQSLALPSLSGFQRITFA